MGVDDIKAKLFTPAVFVCGGHGARFVSVHHGHRRHVDRHFTVPQGITIYFYVRDKDSLPNDVGQRVDRIVLGDAPPPARRTYVAGDRCWNYRLFSSRAGGYLALGMSSKANDRYITTTDKDVGIHLEDIVGRIRAAHPVAHIHWSACRAVENPADAVGWTEPDYADMSPALAALASKAGKTTIA